MAAQIADPHGLESYKGACLLYSRGGHVMLGGLPTLRTQFNRHTVKGDERIYTWGLWDSWRGQIDMDQGQGRKDKQWNKDGPGHGRELGNVTEEREDRMRMWGVLIFGVIGAAAATYAVGQARRTLAWFYSQVNRGTQSHYSWKQGGPNASKQTREEAWNRYNQRMQEEYEEEMERVERIRRMQGVFNRERNKYRRTYEEWQGNSSDAYQDQNFERADWYWKTDRSYRDRKANERKARPRDSGNYVMLHHYEVLGLDMSRVEPYSEAEIKAAFRTKAKEYHPDQNQTNKEAAEAKFKEVMSAYEALKMDKKTK